MRPFITLTLFLLLLSSLATFCQTPIDVAESTIKVAALGEEVFYYGFAEGDQLVFNFEEVKGKELKEIEIMEMPGTSKFMDYKTARISNKTLIVGRTGIYKFRFSNSALNGRICRFRIQRVPASEVTKNFNTNVYWRTEYDTTYTPVTERYLVRTDTVALTVLDQITKVSSQNAMNGNANHSIVDFELPANTTAWSFYIGVGKEGADMFRKGTDTFVNQATGLISRIPGYGPMAALALFGINTFSKTGGSDNVKYWFISDWDNVLAFKANTSFMQYKQGDIVSEASQMKSPLSGKVYIGLVNDNVLQAIEVNIKVTAVQVNQVWGNRSVDKMNVTSRQVAFLTN